MINAILGHKCFILARICNPFLDLAYSCIINFFNENSNDKIIDSKYLFFSLKIIENVNTCITHVLHFHLHDLVDKTT